MSNSELFNVKSIFAEKHQGCYLQDKRVHTFPRAIIPKVNIVAWMDVLVV